MRVLITGKNSYIGNAVENRLKKKEGFNVNVLDVKGDAWKAYDFSGYDTVFHVAGIAHADVNNISEERKALYYKVNGELPEEVARRAKAFSVRQFIYMSSMIIYGESAGIGKQKLITSQTEPKPANFYGGSKWEGDRRVRALADDEFKVAVLRAPMIYGEESKGNYHLLEKIALTLPVFPKIENQRSMLHIDRLCGYLEDLILSQKGGIYFPQDEEYGNTSEIVKNIAREKGKRIWVTSLFNPVVYLAAVLPNKQIKSLVNKAFGNMTYEKEMEKDI